MADDYILEMLMDQRALAEKGEASKIKEALERQGAPGMVEQGGRTGAKISEDGGTEILQRRRENTEGSGAEENVKRILAYLEPMPLSGVLRSDTEQAAWNQEKNGALQVSFRERNSPEGSTLSPEAFSMFFQRDARRYS